MTDTAQWDMNLRSLPGIPQIGVGDDLGKIITDTVTADGHTLQEGDVIVVAQKVVSKAEDRVVRLNSVTPTPRAERLAKTRSWHAPDRASSRALHLEGSPTTVVRLQLEQVRSIPGFSLHRPVLQHIYGHQCPGREARR